ncbi:MAG: hypothetical protein P4L87_06790 [Formivibrio sp.]|nr:hypothetical protein [Formivibrio sp.]
MTEHEFIEIIEPSERGHFEVVRPQAVVCLLFNAFGAVREWSDFLSDCRRRKGNTNFFGLQLLPCGRESETRPLYRLQDVQDFIAQSKLAGAAEPTYMVMFVDPYTRALIREPVGASSLLPKLLTTVKPLH